MLALVDCNSCFASCEQIYRPDLRGKPIVVLSNNDGCIVARNQQAKLLGIPDLEPFFKIKHILEQHQVYVFSSNYELYGDTSQRIMSMLTEFGNAIEIYSIDEAFLNVDGFADLQAHGQVIKQACWKQQRMPVCVGIAPTKTLAKFANHLAKKSAKLNGVCVIEDPQQWQKVFSKIAVNKVWGVGSKTAKHLALHGVHTVQDLRQQSPKMMHKAFGVLLERTVRELNGEPCLSFNTQPQPKKEVFTSRSFSRKITTLQELNESVANYAVRATEKLRSQNSLAQCVYVMVQTSRFNDAYYGNSMSTPLLFPTNDSRDIIHAALNLSTRLFRTGYLYAKAGVGLFDLVDGSYQQDDLFTANQSPRSQTLMQTLDKVNKRYGNGQVFMATQGVKRPWSINRNLKSPAYTTRFADIPIVRL